MHYAVLPVLLGAAGFVGAQKIEIDKVAALPGPELVSAPLVKVKDDPPDVEAPPVKPLTTKPTKFDTKADTKAATKADVQAARLRRVRRSPELIVKRDGDCSPQPTGAGPVPTPDTAAAFVSYSSFSVRHRKPSVGSSEPKLILELSDPSNQRADP